MKIAVIAPSIYMSEKTYPQRIFAPRVVTFEIVNGLAERGHSVTLFSAPDIKTKAQLVGGSEALLKGDLMRDKYLSREPLKEYKLQSNIESQHFYSLDLIGKAFGEAQKNKFDIIQTDEPFVHSFVHLTKTPVVFVFHDPLPRRKSLDYWFLNRYRHHNFISISLAQRKGEPILNYVGNVYHGIKVERYVPSFKKGSYFAYMGRLLVQKGADLAIKAAKLAGEEIRIASDKTHFNTKFVKEKVLPLINGKNAKHVGFLHNQEEKNMFLKNAKALLFPISWEEPFGIAMIEAMSCGTPVIAYNRGSVSEIVRDGLTGFVIDHNRGVKGLVEALKKIDQIDRKVVRRHVEENFTVDRMVSEYEKLYQKLINA